jgi:hypothetical protein
MLLKLANISPLHNHPMAKQTFLFLATLLPFLYFSVPADAGMTTGNETRIQNPARKRVKEYRITENDTLTYSLKLMLDENGKPQYFFRNIFTPVCYTNECKPVFVNFYWDLLGNYMRYDMPQGKILTKVDHDAFKKEDYEKLADILARPNSIFADLKMEDLITKGTDSLTANVDAKTGATLKTIKNEVIDGAVYTCFTLWHIAYGKQVVEKMKTITESFKNDKMLHAFLAGSNYHYQYWAMDKVISKNGAVRKAFEKDIEKIISGKNVFTAKAALQRTENNFFAGPKRQHWLWETFGSSSYVMQNAILKKWTHVPITDLLAGKIAESLTASNPEQFQLKLHLLKSKRLFSNATSSLLSDQLTLANEEFGPAIFELLQNSGTKDASVIDKMEQYKKNNHLTQN